MTKCKVGDVIFDPSEMEYLYTKKKIGIILKIEAPDILYVRWFDSKKEHLYYDSSRFIVFTDKIAKILYT